MFKPVDCLRALSRDIVANAQSGHIGMSLGASSLVYALYKTELNIFPENPDFINRDRVVFSAGHCTPLIYSILHLCGYDITIDDLKAYRTIGSATPGHPEIQSCGVDCSTGPLGQGFASAVGLAIAEKHLSSIFNKPGFDIINHYTYVILGEGCLMEGISYESASIAGELGLRKLIALYDCNKITLDSETKDVFTEDIELRFRALGWDTFKVQNHDDLVEITQAIEDAKNSSRPSLVIVPSVIGLGLDCENTPQAHSYILDENEAREFREKICLPKELFNIPVNMYRHFQEKLFKADKMEYLYNQMLKEYKKKYKKEYELFMKYLNNDFKIDIDLNTRQLFSGRDFGHVAVNSLFESANNLLVGSADLSSSTKIRLLSSGFMNFDNPQNKNIRFGVREFSMASICNGIATYGALVPVCSTFLSFSDYMKPAIRMSALMRARVIYVFTHDSIQVGQDGPTHQPVEQMDMLRTIPHLQVFRPCCGGEVSYAFKSAYKYMGPTAIILSKEKLTNLVVNEKELEKGIYCVYKGNKPIANIFASGADMNLALSVRNILATKQLDVNIYSILRVDENFILPKSPKTNCVIECSSAYTLQYLLGENGLLVCQREFGQSGIGEMVYRKNGFKAEDIAQKIIKLSSKNGDCITSLLY